MSDTIDRTIALDLASLLCSRLCHDMLSPVGALSNGLELLAEEKDPAMRERCFELLEQSARVSANKLKFYRLAFGAAGGFGDLIPVGEPRALIEALLAGKDRVAVNFALGNDMLPKSAVKTLLNFALIAIDALVRGGTIDIAAEIRDGAAEIVVRAAGPRIAFDPTIGHALDGNLAPGDLSSKTAPAAMLQVMAAGLGGSVQYALSEEALVMGAVIPAQG
ncbi:MULTISPECIES: histidine phosphotransferase family protein [Novosphingobium]|uniref:Histidine phosphotransferase family protein n=1 Tax=Novosphingobium humi TaxID=2282397 RepID=A0ABY7U107_9SPHN|nr:MULTISPECIES: histidine phosphotransferase family protein [Novosphingobium]MBN9145289.1 histidine phosphotransferase [Novosphingobium sp.]MDR6709668.1 histidine phosphotransferase ChpT [Novosphingobium sp. 1748]ODU80331.1 MAG: histidine phosphotransferase [Novosphingobium sp. SCN 63-17]OJX88731.1 MAG: histidine phosphotransferase [Novosphingobium sp. 63-713]WCT78014.1 histidine phosphotransferase family protein [Novosphingobium humi]